MSQWKICKILEIWNTLICGKFSDMNEAMILDKRFARVVSSNPISFLMNNIMKQYKSRVAALINVILAMIRERLISSHPNPTEGLGLYKVVKGILMNVFEEKSRGIRNPEIDEQLQYKLKVVGAELSIANALVDPIQERFFNKRT